MQIDDLVKEHLVLAADWWWMHDLASDTITVSSGVYKVLGYNPEHLRTPEAWASIVHEGDQEEAHAASKSAIRTMKLTEMRLRYKTLGGSWKTLLCRMRPVMKDGAPVAMIGINREIDDILAIEHEMLQRNEDLAQVASVLSHDFRGPARHISGCTDRVLDQVEVLLGKLNEGEFFNAEDFMELKNWARLTQRSADRLGRMIEHVLQYSRAGTKGIRPQAIDAADVIADILSDYEDRINKRNIRIKVRSLPTVHYDPTMLYLVLANLVSNAIKFSKNDDPHPQITIEGRHTTVDLASISIRDSGIGIPTSQQEKILEMGFRLHHESEYSGFGYGLAIVRRILNRCGGELGIRSREGEGSEFVVTVPAGRMELQ